MNIWSSLKTPFFALAPMEDVTDVVFREIIAGIGAPDVFFTEFTSAEGMASSKGRESVIKRLKHIEKQKPVIAQIWGITPEAHYKAAKDIVEMGFDGVDINMGCPVKKIISKGACSKLIENPSLAAEIIAATREGTGGQIALSVKTRMGFDKVKTEEWCGFLLDQKLDALIIHGRLAKQMSDFPADWNEVKKVVELRDSKKLDTKIIGNGDVLSLEGGVEKAQTYGVDGLMIGRGVFKNPLVFNKDKSIEDFSTSEKIDLLLKHTKLFAETWGNTKSFSTMKRFFKIYLMGFEGAAELRNELMECSSYEEVEVVCMEFLGGE